ncbi:unnamed protein product [Pseudomonas synxantha]|nr:unnamed protein product [Pseudomonas synxantha]
MNGSSLRPIQHPSRLQGCLCRQASHTFERLTLEGPDRYRSGAGAKVL